MNPLHIVLGVVVLLATAFALGAATGRLRVPGGATPWLLVALAGQIVAGSLYLSGGGTPPSPVAGEGLAGFITSLPEALQGEDAASTRARILAATRVPDQSQAACETLLSQNARFAEMLQLLRQDISAAARLAERQNETIARLEHENERLREVADAAPGQR